MKCSDFYYPRSYFFIVVSWVFEVILYASYTSLSTHYQGHCGRNASHSSIPNVRNIESFNFFMYM